MTLNYEDSCFCEGNCKKETKHTIIPSGHERDSSYDYRECKVCRWYALGIDGFKYHPPIKEVL